LRGAKTINVLSSHATSTLLIPDEALPEDRGILRKFQQVWNTTDVSDVLITSWRTSEYRP
jgi:hypothetical protein